jgi:hypothetical protein
MIARNKKKAQKERHLVRSFLKQARIEFLTKTLRSVQDSHSGPDVRFTGILQGHRIRIGIEVTEYQNDVTDGKTVGSQQRAQHAFFDRIWKELKPMLAEDDWLKQFHGQITFNRDQSFKNDAKQVALQLVCFLKNRLIKSSLIAERERYTFWSEKFCRYGSQHVWWGPGLDTLDRYIKHFTIRRDTFCTGPFEWDHNRAAFVGVQRNILTRIIKEKEEKLSKYSTGSLKEVWLLICGSTNWQPIESFGRATPAELVLPRSTSRRHFHKVVIWERAHEWHKFVTFRPTSIAPHGQSDTEDTAISEQGCASSSTLLQTGRGS